MTERFEHTTVMDGRYHVVTSPDEKGLHVAAPSREMALREAEALLHIIRGRRGDSGNPKPGSRSKKSPR